MFIPAKIIQKKRDGHELTSSEIKLFIDGICKGTVEDYQASAWLMAVFFKGLTLNETVALTQAMVASGEHYDLSNIPGPKVDKHSTGGIGDKTSLILAPLAAACGIKVPMMSGRGLGFTGGTLDKLESIEGFNVKLSKAQFVDTLNRVGCAMIGQSESMVPADRKLYALRDVTGTVESIPLITASILSKKIAEGSQALILDVKVGSGAFMKKLDQAKKLAKTLSAVGKKCGLPTRAVLTQMNQPLGYSVGNAIEVRECIEIMRPSDDLEPIPTMCANSLSSSDLKELTIQLCAEMCVAGKISPNIKEGRKLAMAKIADGSAWKKFLSLVDAQGGKVDQVLHPEKLPLAAHRVQWKAKKAGYVNSFDAQAIGEILVELGGGRKKANESVDPSVGLVFHKKLGARVEKDDALVTVFASSQGDLKSCEEKFAHSMIVGPSRKTTPKLVVGHST